LRPFFKQHGLATKGVQVALIDRKRELTTVQTGDALLYGERLAEDFPLAVYLEKWQRRAIEEPDDWTPARGAARTTAGRGSSRTGFPGGS
jgi:hypothetical protein